MRNSYALLALCLLAPAAAHAQQPWQPFRPGLTYQFSESTTPGDTTHTLQVGAGTRILGTTDSVFRFNGRAAAIPRSASTCNATHRLRPDNLFGATLRGQPRAVFVLAAANGRTLTLRPRLALNQPWAAGPMGLTAQVTARSLTPVLGAAADSVATIQLSDGQTLHLSKRYGLLDGPSLDSYLNGRNRRRALTLTALLQRHLGTAKVGARAAFDFQPGDLFQRHGTTTGSVGGGLCSEEWTQDSVLTRALSRGGDSVTYTIRTRRRSQGYGSPSAPAGFCNTPATTVFYPPTVSTLVVSNVPAAYGPMALTSFFVVPAQFSFGGDLSAPAASSPVFSGRPQWTQTGRAVCQSSPADSVLLTYILDNGSTTRYAAGLGETYRGTTGIYYDNTTQLTYYHKGSQTWGTFTAFRFYLAARDVRPAAATAAFPNPFGPELTATFALARPQAVAAELHDGLGRTVRQVPAAPYAAGAGRLALPTAGLPAGVYTLHLGFGGEGRSEVLRVVKAE